MRHFIILVLSAVVISCTTQSVDQNVSSQNSVVTFPEKAKDMTIYEVNIRQHTPEGTFKAFENDLPRLKELGADMLWIMPIQSIGKKNRKGSLGSYYSVNDYTSVNPEFGTLEDFKSLVNKSHELGFQIILDWVPNHTAWDHPWVSSHPEYYMSDSAAAVVGRELSEYKSNKNYYKRSGIGNLVYESDWDDIALLNLYNAGARKAMIDAMKFWVMETDIDGFRADHAGHEIPLFFWEEATDALNPLKDLFWLAEWDEARMHLTFDATYEWGLLSLTEKLGKGEGVADDLHDHILRDVSVFGRKPFRLNMINNHDRNAWEGTIKERYGDGEKAFAVFSYVSYGVPVLYSGQEVGLDKRLRFFDKDTISMDDPNKLYPFYQKLNEIKAQNSALWNGSYGAMPEKIEDGNVNVFSTRRRNDSNTVVAVINLTGKEQEVNFSPDDIADNFVDAFTGESKRLSATKLDPWEYIVLTKSK